MVYPVAGKEEADLQDSEQMSSGKYEPLVHMNALLSEEIRKTMAEVAGEYIVTLWIQAISSLYKLVLHFFIIMEV